MAAEFGASANPSQARAASEQSCAALDEVYRRLIAEHSTPAGQCTTDLVVRRQGWAPVDVLGPHSRRWAFSPICFSEGQNGGAKRAASVVGGWMDEDIVE